MMESPTIPDNDDGAEGDPEEPALEAESTEEVEPTEEDEADPEVVEIEPEDDDYTTGNGLFDDIEDSSDDGDSSAEGTGDDPLDSLDSRGEALEDAINDGMARLAVVGLEDDESDGLEEEFTEVFEAFRLGFFGADFAQEYVFVQGDDSIDPAWGLLGSMVCCMAVVLWMRPDGDEQLGKVRSAVRGIGGAA